MAAMQDIIGQSPSRLTRSLKINTNKLMKVLEEAVKPWMGGLLLDITTPSSRMSTPAP